MNTRRSIFCFLLFLFSTSSIQAIELSDSSQISLLTCTPGEELYSCFGHSGIRVQDFRTRMDIVFNYGSFDFEQPNFYLNFLRGHMIYMLGVERFSDFAMEYIVEKRTVTEQILALTADDRQTVLNFLTKNARQENREYRYDFLFDNCATRIRDVFNKIEGSKLQYNFSQLPKTKTFRDLINDYSRDKSWENFGMNLLIGLPVDKVTTPEQQMFLPDYVQLAFANATINNGGTRLPFVLTTKELIKGELPKKTPAYFTADTFFMLLMMLMLLLFLYERRTGKHYFGVDIFFFFFAGILGMVIGFLSMFTEHSTTAWNFNLLWAFPLHLMVAVVLIFNRKAKWLKHYALFAIAMIFVQQLFSLSHPRHFHPAIVSITLLYFCAWLRLFLQLKNNP